MQALEQLSLARRVLGYSYVFAFYMFDGATFGEEISSEQNALNQNLFEDQQQQLEREVSTRPTVLTLNPTWSLPNLRSYLC